MNAVEKVIAKELIICFLENGLEHSSAEAIRSGARQILEGLLGHRMTHKEAAVALGVTPDFLSRLRNDGFIKGMPKNPGAKKIHWLYSAAAVVELRQCQPNLLRKRRRWREKKLTACYSVTGVDNGKKVKKAKETRPNPE